MSVKGSLFPIRSGLPVLFADPRIDKGSRAGLYFGKRTFNRSERAGALDDLVTLTVSLSPGSEKGPAIDRERLRLWGLRRATRYRALIGLAYRWFKLGVTRIPANKRKSHWLQVQNPARYESITEKELIDLCFPTSSNEARRNLEIRAREAVALLEQAGDVRIVQGRGGMPILQPKQQ